MKTNEMLPTLPASAAAERVNTSRRHFLIECARFLGSSGLIISVPTLATLTACSRDAASSGADFQTLSGEQGAAMSAFAEQILPSSVGDPGAREAGAVHFIDYAIQGPFSGDRELIINGLADLDARAVARGGSSFADLRAEQQIELMREIEETPFFERARTLVLARVFADPSWGGNRDHVGWDLVKFDHQPTYQPPFGYYDGELMKAGGGA